VMLVFIHLPQIRGMSRNHFTLHRFLWYLNKKKKYKSLARQNDQTSLQDRKNLHPTSKSLRKETRQGKKAKRNSRRERFLVSNKWSGAWGRGIW
jgi:hypothetical protein